MKRVLIVIIFIALTTISLAGGFYFGIFYEKKQADKKPQPKELRSREDTFLISPLVDCAEQLEKAMISSHALKKELENIVAEQEANDKISKISIYFRDLNNGPWLQINPEEKYTLASLFKVPLMMSIFENIQENPEILGHKVLYEKRFVNKIQRTPPREELEIGKEYLIEDLIYRMIAYSDNESEFLLAGTFPVENNFEIFLDLGLPAPTKFQPENYMDIKSYASFFRMLYNVSYTSRKLSTLGLEMLAESDYEDGIEKYIPKNIVVANKFGEQTSELNILGKRLLRQFHDCGIVYTKTPYLICVMTKGYDFDVQEQAIQKISKEIYKFMK